MNDRLVMYLHGGSGNHGCEAIVNSTCRMTEELPKLLVTNSEKEDRFYSLEPLCDILQERKIAEHFFAHVWYYLWRAVFHDPEAFMRYRFRQVLGRNRAPLYLSVGGDMYCYGLSRKEAIVANSTFVRAGAKTILWGCSLAFALEPENIALPERFAAGRTIGINISPMIVRHEKVKGITIANYRRLIDHILQTTDNCVALIPHVMWNNNDDRLTLQELYRGYEAHERVMIFPDMSCRKLKFIISRCRAFIGARTHATIAAYSSCVPTLVVGYSVKARGIARDLFGTEEGYVLPVQALENPEELIQAYDRMMEREQEIRGRLEGMMPEYCAEAKAAGDEIRRIWKECH